MMNTRPDEIERSNHPGPYIPSPNPCSQALIPKSHPLKTQYPNPQTQHSERYAEAGRMVVEATFKPRVALVIGAGDGLG